MNTNNIPFAIYKKKTTLNYPKSAAMSFFSKGLKHELETAVVNEPSVFEPLTVYCTSSYVKAASYYTILKFTMNS